MSPGTVVCEEGEFGEVAWVGVEGGTDEVA